MNQEVTSAKITVLGTSEMVSLKALKKLAKTLRINFFRTLDS